MTNTKAPDGAVVPATTGDQPSLPVVQQSSDKQRSSGGIEASALYKQAVEEAKASLREEFKRELGEAKSTKDRAIKNVEDQQKDMLARYDQLLEMTKDPNEAKWRLNVENKLNTREDSGRSSSADRGTVKPKGLEERALDILAKSKITDPTEQLEIRQEWAKSAPPGGFDSDDDAVAAMGDFIAEFKIAKAKREAPASAAAAIAPRGDAQAPKDKEAIGTRLRELQKGNINDPANEAERKALLAELAKMED
jgi:hypothetical protein